MYIEWQIRTLMRIPRMNSVMTPFPYSVGADAGLEEALEMMRQHGIRHLPVIDASRLVGVVSQHVLERAAAAGGEPPSIRDVMLADPYIVEIDEPLERVLERLAERHLECALVVKEGRLAGIFTMVDAYRRFAEELGRQRTQGGGSDAA